MSVLFLIFGCSSIELIVFSSKVIYKDGLFVSKDTEIPYSGRVLAVYAEWSEMGEKSLDWEIDTFLKEWGED